MSRRRRDRGPGLRRSKTIRAPVEIDPDDPRSSGPAALGTLLLGLRWLLGRA